MTADLFQNVLANSLGNKQQQQGAGLSLSSLLPLLMKAAPALGQTQPVASASPLAGLMGGSVGLSPSYEQALALLRGGTR